MQMGICSDHFKDPHIKGFINSHITEDYCDYCETAKPSAELDDLRDFVSSAVYSEYVEPYEAGAWYDSEGENYEDRFPGLSVSWTRDLLYELLETDDDDVVEDVASYFEHDYLAVAEEISGPSKNEYFIQGWKVFKEVIKHKIRFLFFSPGIDAKFEDQEGDSLNPAYVLEEVGKAIGELGFIVQVPAYSLSIYRARQHELTELVDSAAKLGSPPPVSAKASRMSPAGISMFYGALDVETCKLEVLDDTWKSSALTLGEFVNTRNLKLVDFTNIGGVPSLFDEENRHKRSIMRFIISFVKDISIPVRPDDNVHIEYIPTQVVTEYIKIKLGNEHGIDGILYNSVKNPGKQCIVLFAEYGQIFNSSKDVDKEDDGTFFIDESEKFIKLLNESLVSELI